MPSFVILPLIASGHLSDLDVELPGGRLRWIAWQPEREHPVSYEGAAEGRLFLELEEPHELREAQWVADMISAILDLAHGPSGMRLSVVEVDASAIADALDAGEPLRAADVAELLEVLDERWGDVRGGWWPTDGPILTVSIALPAVLGTAGGDHDAGLPAALLYYKLSTSEFAFLGDSIAWALSEEGQQVPESALDRQRVETAFHNAFKSIEALVGGEPPSQKRRFRARLQAAGVDPDDMVGFRGREREPLLDVLRRVSETRDQRAAHAGRTAAGRRGITFYELMEVQHATAAALMSAVLQVAPEAAGRRQA